MSCSRQVVLLQNQFALCLENARAVLTIWRRPPLRRLALSFASHAKAATGSLTTHQHRPASSSTTVTQSALSAVSVSAVKAGARWEQQPTCRQLRQHLLDTMVPFTPTINMTNLSTPLKAYQTWQLPSSTFQQ